MESLPHHWITAETVRCRRFVRFAARRRRRGDETLQAAMYGKIPDSNSTAASDFEKEARRPPPPEPPEPEAAITSAPLRLASAAALGSVWRVLRSGGGSANWPQLGGKARACSNAVAGGAGSGSPSECTKTSARRRAHAAGVSFQGRSTVNTHLPAG